MKGWGSRARGGAKGRDRNGVTTSLPHNIATALGVHGLLLMCPPCSCLSEDRRAQKEGRCARDARLRQLILKCRGDSKECWEPSNAAWKVGAGERTDEVGGVGYRGGLVLTLAPSLPCHCPPKPLLCGAGKMTSHPLQELSTFHELTLPWEL